MKKKYSKRKETSRARIDQSATNEEYENRHFNFNEQVIQNMEQGLIGESIEFNKDYRQMISPNMKYTNGLVGKYQDPRSKSVN